MRKILIALMVAALVFISSPAVPVSSLEPGEDDVKSNRIYVTTFYDGDFGDLVRLTSHLKKGDTLTISIMSQGGPAIPCLAMVNYVELLKAKGVHIITEVWGGAYSAGAVLWLTGHERIIHSGDSIMFHTAVIFDYRGYPVSRENLDPTARWILDQCNYYIRQYLLNILRDTELVNELLDDEGNVDSKNNMNWYTAEEVHAMGISTKYVETL